MTPRFGASMDIRFGVTVESFVRYITDLGLNHVEFTRGYLASAPETPSPERIRSISERFGVTTTYHAPFRHWNPGSYDEVVRQHSVERVKQTLDSARTAGAAAVVVHGGSVPRRYPEWVREKAAKNAVDSLAECAEYARQVDVPLCLENQPRDQSNRRYTTTPDDLARMVGSVDVGPEYFGVTLDVGHATVNDQQWSSFLERFDRRITVCHLHDNDGTADQHNPLGDHRPIVQQVPAEYFVYEMKSLADVAECAGVDAMHSDIDVPRTERGTTDPA